MHTKKLWIYCLIAVCMAVLPGLTGCKSKTLQDPRNFNITAGPDGNLWFTSRGADDGLPAQGPAVAAAAGLWDRAGALDAAQNVGKQARRMERKIIPAVRCCTDRTHRRQSATASSTPQPLFLPEAPPSCSSSSSVRPLERKELEISSLVILASSARSSLSEKTGV